MALLPTVASILQSAGLGAVGSTIFMGMLPETPDDALAVREYEGARKKE
jgi:hypothetical protein